MTRPIKFRAWEKSLKAMIQIDEIDFVAQMINHNSAWRMIGHDVELMQFTGLTDKNGTEIYEGDILQDHMIFRGDGQKNAPLVVEWGDYTGDIEVGMVGLTVGWCRDFSTIEVIGNIYENKELLK